MERSVVWKLVIILIVVVSSVSNGWSQSGVGSIQGVVRDRTGAVIVGAEIQVTKPATNESYQAVTNSQGIYTVPALFQGRYVVTIAAQGMSSWRTSVSLQVGQTVRIDATMEVATVSGQVTVTGDQTTLLNTENATQDTVVERQRIEQMPLNGRSIAGLITLTTPGYEGGSSNQPRVNGLNWGAFSWVMDGANIDYRDGGGLDNVAPDPDSIQEVRVETSNSSAKFDRPGTAILATRSGTNAIHGSLFETNRDNSYGIARNRQDSTSARAPKYIRNEFGGSVGGPVYLPYFSPKPELYRGKDKSFFFVAWERLELSQNTSSLYYVPTDAMRTGDFSGLTNSQNILNTIYDSLSTSPTKPWTRQPFPGNKIPVSRISPLAKALYAVTPEPTNGNNPYQAPNWIGQSRNDEHASHITFRLDHHFSDQNTAFFRYTWGNDTTSALGSDSTHYGAPTTDGVWNYWYHPLKSQSGSLSWNHIFSPTFYHELVVSMNYDSWNQKGEPDPTKDYTTPLGLQNQFSLTGLPTISGSSTGNSTGSTLQAYGQGSSEWRDNDYTNVFEDNLTLVRGRHLMEFGGRYHHERLNILPKSSVPINVQFDGLGTGAYDPKSGASYGELPNTGLATADFFLGYADAYSTALSSRYLYMREQEISSYFQDNFHVTPNLTANIGGRWEILPAIHERDRQFTSFDYANAAVVTGLPTDQLIAKGYTTKQLVNGLQGIGVKFETPDQAGMPSGVINNNYFNFLPRLGLAWLPFGSGHGLVVRGGYGAYIYPTPTRNFYSSMNGNVPFTYNYVQDYKSAAQSPDGLINYILRSPQTVVAGKNSMDVIDLNNQNAISPGSFEIDALDSKQPPNYYREWNVTVQKDLGHQTAISVAYLGNHGGNLEQQWYTNNGPSSDYVWYVNTGQPKPTGYYSNTATRVYNKTTYGNINLLRKTGWSNSNGVQVNFQRLYHHGFAYQVSYVYSKNFRNGGNSTRDSQVYPAGAFVSGVVSSDPYQLNRLQSYLRDTATPLQRLRFNWVFDLPFGRKQHFFSNGNRVVDEIIGGWQLAGDGTMYQSLWQPATSDWGTFSPLHYYGRKYKVQDCRGGAVCYNAYLAYNGYIPASQVNAAKGVTGLPANYVPAHQPLNVAQGNQNTTVTLSNGQQVTTAYSLGPKGVHPYSHLFLGGPINWDTDASLFKMFSVTDSIKLKVNADFFNVFNQQGTNYPDSSTGIISTTSSHNTARIVQIGARLNF